MKAHGRLEPLVEIDLKPVTKVKLSFIFEDKKVCKVVKVYQTTSELKVNAKPVMNYSPTQMTNLFCRITQGSYLE